MICYEIANDLKGISVRFKLSWLMVWFVIICILCGGNIWQKRFKLSWLMVWFVMNSLWPYSVPRLKFQTKLTYGMICYIMPACSLVTLSQRFKLSWLMVWFVIMDINYGDLAKYLVSN